MRTEEKLNFLDVLGIILLNSILLFPAFIIYLISEVDPYPFFGLVFMYYIDKCYLLGDKIIVDRKLFNLSEDLLEIKDPNYKRYENRKID